MSLDCCDWGEREIGLKSDIDQRGDWLEMRCHRHVEVAISNPRFFLKYYSPPHPHQHTYRISGEGCIDSNSTGWMNGDENKWISSLWDIQIMRSWFSSIHRFQRLLRVNGERNQHCWSLKYDRSIHNGVEKNGKEQITRALCTVFGIHLNNLWAQVENK